MTLTYREGLPPSFELSLDHQKKNPPGGVVQAGHLIGAGGSGGG